MRVKTVLLASVLFFVDPLRSSACQCIVTGLPKLMQKADVVVSGVVLWSEAPGPRPAKVNGKIKMLISGGDMVRWHVALTRIWKGEVPDTVCFYSPRMGAACGVEFEVGREYAIFADSLSERPAWLPELPDSIRDRMLEPA
jgi:hypothetical protein